VTLLERLRDPENVRAPLDFRQETTYVLAALMETMWIAPWFAALAPGARDLPFSLLLLYLAGNVLAAMLITRLLDSWGMWANLRQIVFFTGLILAVLLTAGVVLPQTPAVPVIVGNVGPDGTPVQQIALPPLLIVLALVALLWWRGLRVAIVVPTVTRVAFGVRLGILAFLMAGVFFYDQRAATLTALPLFFFCGLLATSLARATALRAMWRQPVSFGPSWTGFMSLAAAATTLAGLLAAGILSGLDPDVIWRVVQPVVMIPVLIVGLLLTPLFLLIQMLVEALIPLLAGSGLMENALQMPELELPPPQDRQPPQLLQQLEQLFNALGGIQVCLTVLVMVIIVVVIVLTLRQRRSLAAAGLDEREDLESDVLGGLRDALRRGLDALGSVLNAMGQFGLGRDLFAALTVRRVYAQMARLAAKRGYPRAPSETPYEYRKALGQAYPGLDDDAALVTEAYVRVHYGEVPESAEALQEVIRAWERLRAGPDPATRP